MGNYRIDLHNHSCLSPCGSLEMSPRVIAETAVKRGIDLIALTDHNSASNSPAFASACLKAGIAAVYGMEITTSEEIHVLSLFETVDAVLDMEKIVTENYNGFDNVPEKMGDQVYVDEDENIIGAAEKNLAYGSSRLSLEEIGKEIHNRGGLFIPAHIDRNAFSLIQQLGFIPDGDFDAFERIYPETETKNGVPLLYGSDAHYPDDIGKRAQKTDSRIGCFRDLESYLKR